MDSLNLEDEKAIILHASNDSKINLEAIHQRLEKFHEYCKENRYFNIGYPESADLANFEHLEKFFNYCFNNCGDWRDECNFKLNTFEFEKEVIEYFYDIFESNKKTSFGYITTGGTEGNLWGLYVGRECFPQATLYFNENAHYSIVKLARILRIKSIKVKSTIKGDMDLKNFEDYIIKDKPKNVLILATIGTTMSGSCDNVREIHKILEKNGIFKNDYYIHADAALSGFIHPFCQANTFSLDVNSPNYVHSVSVSGHKEIGTSIPCGIAIGQQKYVDKISTETIDYLGSVVDDTIVGSRNGHSALLLWYILHTHSKDFFAKRVANQFKMTSEIIQQFKDNGINAWRFDEYSITIVIPEPSEKIWRESSMASCKMNGVNVSHLIITAHSIYKKSDIQKLVCKLIEDLLNNQKERVQQFNSIWK